MEEPAAMDVNGHPWEYDQPRCIEDYEWNHFHHWDFGYWKWHNFNESPKWFRTPNNNAWDAFVAWDAVYDYGRLGDGYYEGGINQQIGMGANWPAQDPPEPRYAHHNGWWHDGGAWDAKVTAAHRWQLREAEHRAQTESFLSISLWLVYVLRKFITEGSGK